MIPPKYFDFRMFVVISVSTIFALAIIKFGLPNSLDARLFYSHKEAIDFFKFLGSRDVIRYIITEVFDLAFILSYSTFWFLSLKRLKYQNPKIKYVALIPGFFDFIETGSLLLILFEKLSVKSAGWLGSVTLSKWIFIVLLTIIYFFAVARRYFLKNNFKTSSQLG